MVLLPEDKVAGRFEYRWNPHEKGNLSGAVDRVTLEAADWFDFFIGYFPTPGLVRLIRPDCRP